MSVAAPTSISEIVLTRSAHSPEAIGFTGDGTRVRTISDILAREEIPFTLLSSSATGKTDVPTGVEVEGGHNIGLFLKKGGKTAAPGTLNGLTFKVNQVTSITPRRSHASMLNQRGGELTPVDTVPSINLILIDNGPLGSAVPLLQSQGISFEKTDNVITISDPASICAAAIGGRFSGSNDYLHQHGYSVPTR